jgi:hypothetical protein
MTNGTARTHREARDFLKGLERISNAPIAAEIPVEVVKSGSATKSSLDRQVGGNHYKGLNIQPLEFITQNNIAYMEGNVIKYITRHASKNGAADVEKALHYCQLILELTYGKKP